MLVAPLGLSVTGAESTSAKVSGLEPPNSWLLDLCSMGLRGRCSIKVPARVRDSGRPESNIAGDVGRLRELVRLKSSRDIARPPKADAVTVVESAGVGGGRGLSERNSGWINDSSTTGLPGRDEELFFRNRGGILDSSGSSDSVMRGTFALIGVRPRCGSSSLVDFEISRGRPGELGRLPGMGSRRCLITGVIGLAIKGDECMLRLVSNERLELPKSGELRPE